MLCIGGALGFLGYNFYPARVFMGDVGSFFIGGALAGMALVTRLTLLLPIIDAIGVSRLQFGVIHTFNLLIGMCTPPVGVGLMIMSTISGLSFTKVVKSFVPFFIPLVISLLVITYIPAVTTWLPSVL